MTRPLLHSDWNINPFIRILVLFWLKRQSTVKSLGQDFKWQRTLISCPYKIWRTFWARIMGKTVKKWVYQCSIGVVGIFGVGHFWPWMTSSWHLTFKFVLRVCWNCVVLQKLIFVLASSLKIVSSGLILCLQCLQGLQVFSSVCRDLQVLFLQALQLKIFQEWLHEWLVPIFFSVLLSILLTDFSWCDSYSFIFNDFWSFRQFLLYKGFFNDSVPHQFLSNSLSSARGHCLKWARGAFGHLDDASNRG